MMNARLTLVFGKEKCPATVVYRRGVFSLLRLTPEHEPGRGKREAMPLKLRNRNGRTLPSGHLCRALALLVAMAFGPFASPARADLMWGINGHPLVSYPGVSFDQQLDYVQDLNMKSYRVNVSARGSAPRLQRLVAAAKTRGIEILPVLTPALDLDKETAESLYKKAYDMAFALVSEFKGDIRVWELGNELENYAIIRGCEVRDNGEQYNCAWGPAGGDSPLDYYGPRWAKVSAVLKGLSAGTKAADPTVRKAMGTAGWGHTGAFERMQQDGIEWDISVWHMYGQDPEWAFKVLARYNHPIWVTEFNNPLGNQRGDQVQIDGLVLTMTRLRQLRQAYNVEAAHVYELLDETYWAPSAEANMGLVSLIKRPTGRSWMAGPPKPAYGVVKELVANARLFGFLDRDCHRNTGNRLSSAVGMQVSYVYCLGLGRDVDGQGFEDWSSAVRKRTTAPQLLLGLLESEEFRNKHKQALSGGSAEVVSLLYRVLLDREPDEAGKKAYVTALEDGSLTAEDVAADMVGSAEFRARHPVLFVAHGPDGKPIREGGAGGSKETE